MKKGLWILIVAAVLAGCAAQKPATQADTQKLNESKAATESTLKELRDLRLEKAKLEAEKEKAAEKETDKKSE